MKKILFCGLFLLSLSISAAAQVKAPTFKVTGIMRDSVKNEAVSFGTVLVTDTTKKYIASTYSDEKGFFEFRAPNGPLTIVAGFTGYTPDTLHIEMKGQSISLDTIYLTEGIQIGSVQVLGQLVTTDIDKTTYNLAADPETPALTGLEMMRKVPMLTVDGEDNIQLKGQSDFKILVNGKPSTMMTKNYKDVLKSMPANSIKSIEVITNPPAKYDAEGLGGLINIITVRKTNNGYNGSINAGVDQWGGVSGGGYIAAQVGKLALSANLYVGQHQSPETGGSSQRIDSMSFDRQFIEGETSGSYSGLYGGLQIEASYEIDSLNLLTLALGGNLGNSKSFNEGVTEFWDVDHLNITSAYKSRGMSQNMYGYLGGNLDYQHSFQKPDETLTVSYKFEYNPDNSYYENELYDPINYPDIYNRRSKNDANSMEHTLQVDYFNPLTKIHQIEAGVKFIYRPNVSNTFNETLIDQEWQPDNRLRNDLDYNQYIGSFYGGYALKLKKFSAKLGFRGEFTLNDGTVKLEKENIGIFNRYFNVVPYVTLNYKLDEVNSLRLGYTQRLNRPSIWRLNPYVNDLDPLNISSGNPNLESVLNHSISFSYSLYKQKWNINAGISTYLTDNSIEYISTLLPLDDPNYPGAMYSRPENIGHRENYRANLGGSVRFLDGKLNVSLNGSASYTIIDAPQANLYNEGWNWDASANIYAQPWKGGGVSLYGGVYSPSVNIQSRYSMYFYNGINVSQAMLKKKLRVSLSCQNPFETKKYRENESWGAGFSSTSEYWSYARNIRLSVQWSFGKMETQVKKARRGISNDDGGAGGGGGGGSKN